MAAAALPESPPSADQRTQRDAVVGDWMSGLGPIDAEPPKPAPKEPPKEPPPTAPAPAAVKEPPAAAPASPAPPEREEDKFPRTSENWKKFVAARDEGFKQRDEKIKTYEQRIKEFEDKLAAAPATIDPKEFESVKSERDKLSENLRLAAVERHPKFQAYYDNKTNAQIDLAKRIVGSEKSDAIAELLKTPDSRYRQQQIEELMADMTPLQQSRLGGVLNALEDIRLDREQQIATARDDYERAVTKQQQDAETARTQARTNAEKLFESTLKGYQDPKTGLAVFQLTGDEAWNKSVTERVNVAKGILFGNQKPEELVRHALAAASVPALLANQEALLKELEALKEQNKQLAAAQPTVNGNRPAPAGGARQPIKSGTRPMDVVSGWMSELQQTQEGQ